VAHAREDSSVVVTFDHDFGDMTIGRMSAVGDAT
jgi:hypothetical protein